MGRVGDFAFLTISYSSDASTVNIVEPGGPCEVFEFEFFFAAGCRR